LNDFQTHSDHWRAAIETRLRELLPAETLAPQNLSRAIRYAALAPGKRLRGLMTLLAAGADPDGERRALDTACAIEMVHTASLVIDDMPFMDDAAMRRGVPATHRVFGEDTATLCAFALLNRAYGVIAADGALDASLRAELAVLLHQAVGTQGLIGGQELDLHTRYQAGDLDSLSEMYHQKTGVLFIAAAEAGGRIAGLDRACLQGLRRYAHLLGLAYQVADDLADIVDARGELTGARDGHTNIVGTIGAARTTQLLRGLVDQALASLRPLDAAGAPLAALTRSMFNTANSRATPPAQQIASA
jgi:geranylgeranyl diphosphate synthase type II